MRTAAAVVALFVFSFSDFAVAEDTADLKEKTPLTDEMNSGVGPLAAGVTIDCAILNDDSMAIIASNTSSTNYSCTVKCDLKTTSGSTTNFSCTPTLPAKTSNGVICSSSGPFSSIVGGGYNCK